jgi:hypothetical protein
MTTGALFQDPSSGVASRVLPKFQPGWRAATKSVADMELKDPVQLATVEVAVCVTVVVVVVVVVAVVVVDEAMALVSIVVVFEIVAVAVMVMLVVAVPGTH